MSDLTKACDVSAISGFEISSLPQVCPRCGWKVENLPGKPSAKYMAGIESARLDWSERTLVSEKPPELERDPFEYREEWKSRLESSAWLTGQVRLDPKGYDVDECLYTLRPDWQEWLKEMKQNAPSSVTLEAERDIARKLYNEESDIGYTVAVRLSCDLQAEKVSPREYLLAAGKGELLPLKPVAYASVQAGSALPGMEFVNIPAGSFQMGSPSSESGRDSDEKRHLVTVQSFELMTTEVTQRIWEEVMGNNPSQFSGNPNHPVNTVSWDDCQKFIERLNSMNSRHIYRLPTEAEWEYACRAGTTTRYYWGDDPSETQIGNYAWNRDNSNKSTHPVGTKLPNAWGLYDMSGNVWEWCEDVYTDNYDNCPTDGSAYNGSSSSRVIRGGSWSAMQKVLLLFPLPFVSFSVLARAA